MKKLLFVIFFLFLSTESRAELLKASPLLNPKQVLLIQLSALNNNDFPYKNFGIEQTWEFAHPKNREFTGPLENFTKMMYSPSYIIMLNHQKHVINEIAISENIAIFIIEIVDSKGSEFAFRWIVERVQSKGDFFNCWMTTSVSTPIKYGESA